MHVNESVNFCALTSFHLSIGVLPLFLTGSEQCMKAETLKQWEQGKSLKITILMMFAKFASVAKSVSMRLNAYICVHILMPLRQNVCRQFQVFVVSRLAGFEKSEARGNGVN